MSADAIEALSAIATVTTATHIHFFLNIALLLFLALPNEGFQPQTYESCAAKTWPLATAGFPNAGKPHATRNKKPFSKTALAKMAGGGNNRAEVPRLKGPASTPILELAAHTVQPATANEFCRYRPG
jgi:hypothetical protein